MSVALTVRVVAGALPSVSTSMLVVPVFESDTVADHQAIDTATGGELSRALQVREFRAKPYEAFGVSPAGWATRRILLVGAGARADWTTERTRRVATAGALAARARGAADVAFVLTAGDRRPGEAEAQAAAEGLVLAAHDGDALKTTPREAAALREAAVVVPDAAQTWSAAVERGRVLGEASNLARELANEPGNHLPPRVLAERAAAAVAGTGLALDVIDEHGLERLGMGLLLGVGRGSAEPPRLIVVRHTPGAARESRVAAGPVLGLIGKGITFDTGGISIKPSEGMERMKTDMSGGAAVIAAMRAIAQLDAPIPVVGLVPAAENMPGGRAIRPGDVLEAASGKTVEVNNTDAEGRLVLADALWHAQQLGATHLVDVATLTGACVVALGQLASGLFATPAWWGEIVRETAMRAGDRVWPLPLHDDYLELLKSDIADIVNTGGRAAGAITAAMFLREFAGGRPWAHLDIAGTAWADESKPWQPKGTTGVAVRTLAELAFTSAAWPADAAV
jgi:leucyl aminopeptidase